ncbi:MAG: Rieske (2Fe-2S) protein [Gammaproteobacteria bacterium]|jgi:nitrite reductase/ring-hydroxylating ferredoxin subunit|nr:Rieske (2Fe-2S) protein [Gammaproteobacteria bacterium]MDC0464578.1 Rieske (2Fe-2S) protein [Pseudomonadales bacterium]
MSLNVASASALWVGSYQRRMAVSLDRMYENALDWAHLPFLHQGSFASIELIDAGDWGWRAALVSAHASEQADKFIIELSLDRTHRRWISSTLEGPGAGSEIWTHVFEYGSRDIAIQADFFVPGVALDQKARVGASYQKLYQGLYDEDEAMMLGRQAALDQRGSQKNLDSKPLDLGALESVRASLPFDFEFNGQSWRLIQERDELLVHSLTCPHQLGSFADVAVIDGTITCPWHGYRFDVRSGRCATGQTCSLPAPPVLVRRGGRLEVMAAISS